MTKAKGMKTSHYRSLETRWLAENREWLEKTHPGKWIAVEGAALIAVGDDAVDVMAKSKAKGVEHPLLDVVRSTKAQKSIVIRSPRTWR